MNAPQRDHAAVIVHTSDALLAKGLFEELEGVTLLKAADGDDLGRLLTSDHDIACLVAHIDGESERGWRRIALIHDQLPKLPILAYLTPDATSWDHAAGPCPASAIVRGPTDMGELARAVRVAGSLPVEALSADAADIARSPSRSRAVIGLAGGVGTTSIAAILAVRLALEGPTILVDLDQRHGAMAGTLRVTPRYTNFDLAGAFDDPGRLDDALPSVLTPVHTNLQLLAGRDEPDLVVARMGTGDASTIRELIRASLRTGAQVVVDFGDLPLALFPVLSEVSEVVIVASHDIRCVRRLPLALSHLADRAPSVITRTVLNRVVSGLEPSARQLGSLVHRPWDVVVAELPSVLMAQNDTNRNGLLDLAVSPPRALDVLTAELLDIEMPSRAGRKRRRRVPRALAKGRTEPTLDPVSGAPS